MSGAEKALLVAFSLAIVILAGSLIRGGSDQAAGDAQRTLAQGMGAKANLGQLMQPRALARAGAVQATGQAPPAPPPAAPPAAVQAPAAPQAAAAPQAVAAPRHTGPAPPQTIGNFRELAQFVFERYETGEPIGIVRLQGFARPTYLVVLSGTERRPGQTTWIPEDIWSAFNQSDKYRDNILAAMQAHGIPQGADIVVAGHSLGGMEAQNLITDARFRARYNANSVVTYGSPITAVNRPGVQYARFAAYGDLVPRASPLGAAGLVARTAAWGGHYILKWGSLGRIDRRPRYDQEMIGPYRATWDLTFQAHSSYRDSPDLERYPLNGPGGRPLQLDTGDFRTYPAPNRPRSR